MGQPAEQNHIQDKSGDRKYFTIIPQFVWAKCRDTYDLALWHFIKMVAAEKGECILSTPDLAKGAGMSTGKANDCRKYLLDAGLIEGELRRDPDYPQEVWHLTVPDLWPQNVEWRSTVGDGLKDRIEWSDAYASDAKEKWKQREHSRHKREYTPQKKELSCDEKQKELSCDEKGTPPHERKKNLQEPSIGSPDGERTTSGKKPSQRDYYFEAMCDILGWDWNVITEEQRGQLNQTIGILKKNDYTVEDLSAFKRWWYKNHWKGERNQTPDNPAEIRKEIGKVNKYQGDDSDRQTRWRQVKKLGEPVTGTLFTDPPSSAEQAIAQGRIWAVKRDGSGNVEAVWRKEELVPNEGWQSARASA